MARRLFDSIFSTDTPIGTDGFPAFVLHCPCEHQRRALALRLLEGPTAATHPVKLTPAATTITLSESGKRVIVGHAYTPKGTLIVTIPPAPADGDPGQYVQDAAVAFVIETASMRQVDVRRRGIILHNVNELVPCLQRALRKTVETTYASALFVLTTPHPEKIDAALRSRAVVVNCCCATPHPPCSSTSPSPSPSPSPSSYRTSNVASEMDALVSSKGGKRAKVKWHKMLMKRFTHQEDVGDGTPSHVIRSIVDWAGRSMHHAAACHIATIAAAAEHHAVVLMNQGCPFAFPLAGRWVLAEILALHAP